MAAGGRSKAARSWRSRRWSIQRVSASIERRAGIAQAARRRARRRRSESCDASRLLPGVICAGDEAGAPGGAGAREAGVE